jgi:hypothetical protein
MLNPPTSNRISGSFESYLARSSSRLTNSEGRRYVDPLGRRTSFGTPGEEEWLGQTQSRKEGGRSAEESLAEDTGSSGGDLVDRALEAGGTADGSTGRSRAAAARCYQFERSDARLRREGRTADELGVPRAFRPAGLRESPGIISRTSAESKSTRGSAPPIRGLPSSRE